MLRKLIGVLVAFWLAAAILYGQVMAVEKTNEDKLGLNALQPSHTKIGMHVLTPEEFIQTANLFRDFRYSGTKLEELYITIPFTLNDIDQLDRWQTAFNYAKKENIIPIVRLGTKIDTDIGGWKIPTRYDVVSLANALAQLDWPQSEKHLILFNEPNHAAEWGGQIDPSSFADMTNFTLDWLVTDQNNYVLLPAAMDLAASNTGETAEAFWYWEKVLAKQPQILEKFSGWNSHSYPNPAFMGSAQATGKNSLVGYRHELNFLAKYSAKDWPVYITETGWINKLPLWQLQNYYRYALKNVWSDEKVVAVTPFVLAGSPGPFSGFSFISGNGEATPHWVALQQAMKYDRASLLSLLSGDK